MRPGEGVVKDVNTGIFCFLGVHDLEVDGVGGVVSTLNGIVHILDVVVRSLASETKCFICVKVLNASVRLDAPFDVDESAVLLSELVCVYAERVNVTELLQNVSSVLAWLIITTH